MFMLYSTWTWEFSHLGVIDFLREWLTPEDAKASPVKISSYNLSPSDWLLSSVEYNLMACKKMLMYLSNELRLKGIKRFLTT